jgi:cytochrome P450
MSADESKKVLDYPFRPPAPLEPPKEWAQLRQGCPVAHVRLPSGDTAVLLTRYDDVKQVMSDPRFTRRLDAEDAARITANESGGVFGKQKESAMSSAMSSMSSGEGHQRWRRLLSKSFTAKRMMALHPDIERITHLLIDAMQRQGNRAELVSSLGFPLPVWVICKLLGVPDSDRDKFAYWSNTMLSLTQYTQAEIDAAQADFGRYFFAHIAAKRQAPGDDLLSELITVVDSDDGRMSEMELMATGQGLLVAGHETTSNMIGKMVSMLLADRRRWEQLLADPSLVRSTVEEVLRFDANGGFGLPRYISEEVELSGGKLPRGTTVICNLSAANRDEKAFSHAEEMDLRRSPNAHLSFGAGPYSCLGQALARTELQTVLSVLLRRLPTLELDIPAEALPRREGLIVGGLEKVPVRW